MAAFMALKAVGLQAQRMTDKLDRGLVAVKVQNGVYCSWRIYGEEYYDVTYNLYRDGKKIADNLTTSNYTDSQGTASSKYTVSAVVRNQEQSQSQSVSPLSTSYLEIKPRHDSSITSTLIPNDACCADVDGDGQMEILLKYDNQEEIANLFPKNGNNGEYSIFEVLKMDGTVLWWVNCGPNMGDFQNNEQNIVGYDWDMDGKAEVVMRLEEGSTIHLSDGTTYTLGSDGKNGTKWTNYRTPKDENSVEWFTHYGNEFLVYCNGQTGQPYVVTEFPLKRLESGETDLKTAWGDGYGHRSSKFFFGAPYLDGRKPSLFLARGIYTRHKMIAYDVDPATHQLTERWRWNCNDSSSPYYGQGYHNYAIADVDWDGRDEICFGSMVIDDNGKGLSTTGLGHGDAQHHGDFDPYSWGQEIFTCNEDRPANCYRDATTSKIRYRMTGSDDDGRGMAANFCNDYPGAMAFSAHDNPISCVTNQHINELSKSGCTDNMRIYWDGDLCEESFNYTNGKNTAGGIYKYGKGLIATLTGSMTNNDTKGTPCYQGDLFGDWREEIIMRTAANNIRIYTTTAETRWRNYTLWHDHQYRNAMVWQMCGYNQPPHVSYFLGELENITMAPPALTMTGRTEIANGGTISNKDEQVITCETGDMTVNVTDGAAPYLYIDNAPSWVQGTNSTSTTNPDIKYNYYTHTLAGGAFAGEMRLVKQGDGMLVLPKVTETYSGPTDVWAGKLQFDGTMQNSRVWLNRHTTLISSGNFPKGIQADYNSTILPGGDGKVGTITVGELSMGFGSRIVFDMNDGENDKINVTTLVIEKKKWPKGGGPVYDVPVFRIQGSPAAGEYLLGEVASVTGNIGDVIIEGVSGKKAVLAYEDEKLKLTLVDYEAKDLVWTGSVDGKWNTDATANFTDADGQSSVFVPGSNVVISDQAQQTTITVSGDVAPKTVAFNNETKTFTLTGDSLRGEATLTKTGAGEVRIQNVNHLGATTISGGKLTVSSLANNSGKEYGSLGDVKKIITIENGATLSVAETATSNQPIRIGEGGGVIAVSANKTLTQSGPISGSSQTLTKTGSGTLNTPASFSVKKLIIQQGIVSASQSNNTVSLPENVEFQGGTLYSPTTDGMPGFGTKANFIVPEGKKGTFYGSSRGTHTGKLTGLGTFTVYGAGVRCYWDGDWSAFEGTLIPALQKRGSYDPTFDFRNNKGLPKATLRLNSGVTFNSTVNISVANVIGTGTLGGSVTYTIGEQNDDIMASFNSTAPVVKKGSGYMYCTNVGSIAGGLTVEEGELRFFDPNMNKPFFGTKALTLSGTGTIVGCGMLGSLTMNSGTQLTPVDNFDFGGEIISTPATIKTNAAVNIKAGAMVNFVIQNTSTYSKLEPKYFTMNGTVKVTLLDDYTPKVGDSFTLWNGGSFSGKPSYDLPTLPAGLYWNTTAVAAKTGILSITNDPALGIGVLPSDAQVVCEVYTVGGQRIGSFECLRGDIRLEVKRLGVQPGAYIVRMQGGRNFDSETVIIR